MKILIVHRLIAAFGGAHKYLQGLIERLGSSGWEVHLAINPNPDTKDLIQSISNMGAQIHKLDFDQLGPQESGAAFDQLINSLQPDVIDFEAAAKSLRQLALNSELFTTTDAHKLFTMHLPIITDQSSLRGWKRHIPGSHARQGINERKRFLKLFDSGLSVSNFHARNIGKLLRLPKDFFTVIPNGVDTELFHPKTDDGGKRSGPCKILASGGLTRQKRFDLLISAAAQLKSLGHEFTVDIAGEGVERAHLEQQITKLGLSEIVNLKGHVKNIPNFLRTGDIYVMCSDSEGLPYAALEAMATGLPMVVTRAGELPFIVQDGQEGFVVNCGNVKHLTRSLEDLLKAPNQKRKMGECSRKKAKQEFNSVKNWKRVDLKYQRLTK